MNLKDIVTSFEISKKLKELGVKQESYFVYFKLKEKKEYYHKVTAFLNVDERDFDIVSAFTVSELLEMMPLINGTPFQLLKGLKTLEYEPIYCSRNDQIDIDNTPFLDKNPADSIAKYLIYLIEKNIINKAWIDKKLEKKCEK